MLNTTPDNIDDRYKKLLTSYNKLEKMVKASQLIFYIFRKALLNESRYFARALVDYNLAGTDETKDKALSRAEVALSAAYNDVIDSIVQHIKISVRSIKGKFINSKVADHLNSNGYGAILDILIDVDAMIVSSREHRNTRLNDYIVFSETNKFNTLVDFAFKIEKIIYLCEVDELDTTEYKRTTRILDNVEKALKNHNRDITQPFFILFLQPKYSISPETKLSGVEALLRLQIPKMKDPSTPDSFLKIASDANLEHEIGEWVLNESVKILTEWKDKKIIPKVFDFAINLAPSQVVDCNFIDRLHEAVRVNNIEDILSIEILEKWIHEKGHHKDTCYSLRKLHDKTRVAIDDFGTGSTRISYLAEIDKLDSIKIDKELIDAISSKNNIKSKQLVEGIASLGKARELKIVAEGVESKEQFDYLKGIGVDYIQGYFLDKPMPVNDLEKKLSTL